MGVSEEKAAASFDRFRAGVGFRRISEVLVVFALISWSTGCFPAALRLTGAYMIDFSDCLRNHHVVFLIGNAIIVLLFVLCRESGAGVSGGSLYDDYMKYSEAAVGLSGPDLPSPSTPESEPEQIAVEARAIPECDEAAAAAIEKARRQMDKFRRTQSEKLKREISATMLRRSETDNCRKTASCWASGMESLSNEEFRMKVDAFIDAQKNMSFENYPLLKMA